MALTLSHSLTPALKALAASVAFTCAIARGSDLLFPNADFETGTLEGWTREGDAFEFQPTKGDNSRARGRESSEHQGDYWIGGFEKRSDREDKPGGVFTDDAVGKLISPEFKITRPYLTFLIGGGYHPGRAGVKLLCDGQEIELASGGDSETLRPVSQQVFRFIGKRARIVVYDDVRGDWGHINVDSFRAADAPLVDPQAGFSLDESIPTAGCDDPRRDEPLRPQFHFTACQGWLNDPNGMVFDGEKYHLFFQHNPLAPVWGNMTWGHATSPDMIHWTQQDHALRPYTVDRRSGTIFSGTAVVDRDNSLGVQRGDQKTLCAFFTFANRPRFYQAMAYSTDGGAAWTYWNQGRAVVDNQGFDREERDPKVFWHEPSGRWIMALWVSVNPGRVRFFTSEDLVHWEHASDLMRDWAFECMDMVFLPVDGDPDQLKAVIYDASFDYEVGTFDGREFHTEHGPYRAGGGNYYAAQTFNNNRGGRAVQIGWMRGGPNSAERYGLPFNQQMSVPNELTLRTVSNDVRLFAWPIHEMSSLVATEHEWHDQKLSAGVNLLSDLNQLDLADLEIAFDPGTASAVVMQLGEATLSYDSASQRLMQRGVNEQGESIDEIVFENLKPRDGLIKLRLLIDRLSVESYAFDGEQFHAAYYAPQANKSSQSLHALDGDATIHKLVIRELRSAWRAD